MFALDRGQKCVSSTVRHHSGDQGCLPSPWGVSGHCSRTETLQEVARFSFYRGYDVGHFQKSTSKHLISVSEPQIMTATITLDSGPLREAGARLRSLGHSHLLTASGYAWSQGGGRSEEQSQQHVEVPSTPEHHTGSQKWPHG